MNKIILTVLMILLPIISHASTYEITTPGNNIGIGSTNPGQALDVNGTIRATAFQAGTGSAFISGSGGNVGISNASGYTPAQQLDVNGTAKMTGFQLGTSTTANYVLTASSGGVGTWQAATGGVNWSNITALINSAAVNWPNINSIATENTGGINWPNINALATMNVGGINWPNISTYANGSVLAAVTPSGVNWSNNINFNGTLTTFQQGNVGIGSATPGTILDVQGTIRATAYDGTLYTNSNIGIGTTTINWNNGYAQNVGIGTSSGAYIKFTAPTGSGIANLHLRILQDGTGSRPLPNFSNVSNLNWCTGTAPTLSTAAGAWDWLDFRYYGGNYDGCATTGF